MGEVILSGLVEKGGRPKVSHVDVTAGWTPHTAITQRTELPRCSQQSMVDCATFHPQRSDRRWPGRQKKNRVTEAKMACFTSEGGCVLPGEPQDNKLEIIIIASWTKCQDKTTKGVLSDHCCSSIGWACQFHNLIGNEERPGGLVRS